jgi:hypothetical protein
VTSPRASRFGGPPCDIKKPYVQHRKETQGQIKRLEKIFKSLGQKPETEPCPGIEELITPRVLPHVVTALNTM